MRNCFLALVILVSPFPSLSCEYIDSICSIYGGGSQPPTIVLHNQVENKINDQLKRLDANIEIIEEKIKESKNILMISEATSFLVTWYPFKSFLARIDDQGIGQVYRRGLLASKEYSMYKNCTESSYFDEGVYFVAFECLDGKLGGSHGISTLKNNTITYSDVYEIDYVNDEMHIINIQSGLIDDLISKSILIKQSLK